MVSGVGDESNVYGIDNFFENDVEGANLNV